MDVFLQYWRGLDLYLYPPTKVLGRVIQKFHVSSLPDDPGRPLLGEAGVVSGRSGPTGGSSTESALADLPAQGLLQVPERFSG